MTFDRASTVTIAIIVVIVAVAAWYTLRIPERSSEESTIAPDSFQAAQGSLGLTDLEGNPVSLEQFAGRVVVANSWASWCPFCVNELPDFAELVELYPEDEVVVLAINRAEPLGTITGYLNTIDELPGVIILQDTDDSFYDFIGGFTMPETVFYDPSGAVSTHKRGFMDLAEMQRLTEKARNQESE